MNNKVLGNLGYNLLNFTTCNMSRVVNLLTKKMVFSILSTKDRRRPTIYCVLLCTTSKGVNGGSLFCLLFGLQEYCLWK